MAFVDVYADVTSASAVEGVVDHVNESYTSVLQSLLPPGRIWEYASGDEFYELLRALSYALLRVEYRGQDLIEELDPRTTYELLPDWERVLDLPGANPTPPTTIAGRRQAVHTRLLGHGDPNKSFFEEVADGAGYDASVSDRMYAPFVAGSSVGATVACNTNGGWAYVWEVLATAGTDRDLLTWSLDQVIPAHTVCLYQILEFAEYDAQLGSNGAVTAARGPDLYIVAGNAGKLSTSTDATLWTAQTSGFGSNRINEVIYAGGLYVAVGYNGVITTSPDGVAWTARTSGFGTSEIYGVYYSQALTLFVAHGANGKISTSPDGVTWTARTSGFGTTGGSVVLDVTMGAGLLVAVGVAGQIATSPDGITWTIRASGVSANNLTSIVFADTSNYGTYLGKFVVAGRGTILLSSNGTDWRAVNRPVTAVEYSYNVAVGNGAVVMSEDNHSRCFASYDGGESWVVADIAFSAGTADTRVHFDHGFFVACAQGEVAVSRDGKRWSVSTLTTTAETDVRILSPHPTPDDRLRGAGHIIVFDRFKLGGYTGYIGAASISAPQAGPGFHWTQIVDNASATPYNVAVDTLWGTWVIVGAAVAGQAYIVTSPDGLTWTARANPKNFDLYGIASDNTSVWIAVGAADGTDAYILKSTDQGATWTEKTNPKNYALGSVAHHNGRWVAVGLYDTGDAYIITSDDDGDTWTERSNSLSDDLRAVAHNGVDLWVAVGDAGQIVTSPDGVTWTVRTSGVSETLRGVAYDTVHGCWRVVGLSDGAASTILRSYNGVDWAKETAIRDANLLGLTIDSYGRSVAVGSNDGYQPHVAVSNGPDDDWLLGFTPPITHASDTLYAAANRAGKVVAVGWHNANGALILYSEQQVIKNASY